MVALADTQVDAHDELIPDVMEASCTDVGSFSGVDKADNHERKLAEKKCYGQGMEVRMH